jgi:hypothetical protein
MPIINTKMAQIATKPNIIFDPSFIFVPLTASSEKLKGIRNYVANPGVELTGVLTSDFSPKNDDAFGIYNV